MLDTCLSNKTVVLKIARSQSMPNQVFFSQIYFVNYPHFLAITYRTALVFTLFLVLKLSLSIRQDTGFLEKIVKLHFFSPTCVERGDRITDGLKQHSRYSILHSLTQARTSSKLSSNPDYKNTLPSWTILRLILNIIMLVSSNKNLFHLFHSFIVVRFLIVVGSLLRFYVSFCLKLRLTSLVCGCGWANHWSSQKYSLRITSFLLNKCKLDQGLTRGTSLRIWNRYMLVISYNNCRISSFQCRRI